MKSYKEEFNQWVKEKNIELFPSLSDVIPKSKYDLHVGQTCTFRNYCFVDFPGHTIMGFCTPSYGRCVYLDYDCYWMAAHPNHILLDGTKDQQCIVEIEYADNYTVLVINRIRCILQSFEKDSFVNLSPIQTGLETFEERLDNVRIDFEKNKIYTDGKKSVKWNNFSLTIDIAEVKQILDNQL